MSSISSGAAYAIARSPVSAPPAWSTSIFASTRVWSNRMSTDNVLPLAGRTVLGVFAHPDDESLACGGTLARLADAGCRVVVVCATHGEGGSISDPALVPDGDLGDVRVQELRDAAAVLGVADVIVLDHPD